MMMKYTKDLYSKVIGSGKAILLIHGIMNDHESLESIQEILGKEFSTITYNRRGYGVEHDSTFRDYSVEKQAEDAAAVLKRYTDRPAYIIGDSTGGEIAVRMAILFPELVLGIFLVEACIPCKEIDLSCLRGWQEEVRHIAVSGDIYKVVPLFSRITESKPVTHKSKLKNIKKTVYNIRNYIYGEMEAVLRDSFSYEEVSGIMCPIVMGISVEGKDLPFGRAAKKTADFFGWETVYLPGHHNTIQEYPQAFYSRFKEFIQTQE